MLVPKNYNHLRAHGRRTAILATILSIWAMQAFAREPNVETVSLYFTVEKNNAFVQGLAQGNFRLYEAGQAMPFRLAPPETTASIALLVEYSQSSAFYVEEIEAAVEGFLKHAPEDNWYAVATFDRELEIRADFTKQIGRVREAFLQTPVPMWNEVNTYDAIYEMVDKLGRLPGRRVLIVVGSGVDTFSEHTMDDVQKKIESENVNVFTIALGAQFRTTLEPYLQTEGRLALLQAQSFLKTLADSSGGYTWTPNHLNAFPDAMRGAMQALSLQYRIVYDSRARGAGKLRKIKIEAFQIVNDKREDFTVRARTGWR